MTPATFFVVGVGAVLLWWAWHTLTRPTPPDFDLPADWRPRPGTVVQTHHLTGGRSW